MRLTALTGRHRSTIWKVLAPPRLLAAPAQPAPGRPRAALSGPRPGRCCTSTPSASPSSTRPDTGRPAIAPRSPAARRRQDGRHRRRRRPHPPGLLRAAQRRERRQRLRVPQTRRRLVPRAGLRPGPGGHVDNAKCYTRSHAFADSSAELGARHILIPPYTPRWNGKIERFLAHLDTEWAHGRVWPNSTTRDRALASLHPLLQPQTTPLSRRRPSTHHPRSPSPRAEHLAEERAQQEQRDDDPVGHHERRDSLLVL